VNPSVVTTTEAVDAVFFFIFGISALMLVGITATIIFFVVKYNRRRNPAPQPSPNYNIPLETAWTILPTIIVLVMFWYGWSGYTTLRNVPADALPVKVVGRQWSWSFEYANGRTSDRLFVPAGRPVRLELTSADVLHNFYIPAFRVKVDAVPGMTTQLWFMPQEPGSYDAFCAEYCGVAHSAMITTVEALPADEFERWYAKVAEEVADGSALLEKHGCLGCHSLDGTPRVGPTFKGLFGRQVTVITDGKERTLTADADYIRHSIREPQADLVKGFPPVMPQLPLPEEEVETIVEFLQGLAEKERENAKAEEKDEVKEKDEETAEGVYEKVCATCHATGVAGAPKVGDREAWKERIDKGMEALVGNAIKGIGAMPPRGGNSSLSDSEVEAAVRYMVEESR
jgi:cytochrome c oxidase subunit 2